MISRIRNPRLLYFVTALWVGAAIYFGYSLIQDIRDSARAGAAAQRHLRSAQALIARKDEVDARLRQMIQALPARAVAQTAVSGLLSHLDRLAASTGLTLIRRDSDRETDQGQVREVTIQCTWEAGLESLVRFLYALQSEADAMEVVQLTITPVPGAADRLRGSLLVKAMFTRSQTPTSTEEVSRGPEGERKS
jgi:Tfp pilus assembly protein PilO